MKKQAFITFHGTRMTKMAAWMAVLAALLSPVRMCRGQGSTPAASPPHRLIFHPPVASDGALGERVGGGARGAGGTDASLVAIVPDQVALTTQEQPSLFWFQSRQARAQLELTLIEPGKPQPLLALGSQSTKPGIHRIRLSNHGVKLTPNVAYKWTVSLVPNPASRSLDVVATGMVKRIEPTKELTQELAGATAAERPAIYAQAGIWYDALEAISDEIDKHPDDSSLRKERADLLKQVGLPPMDKQ